MLILPAAFALLAIAVQAQQGGITTGGSSQRPIYVSGKVLLSDGQPPPQPIDIELVCQTQVQPQGKTDSKGGFNLQLGANRFEGFGDAAVTSSAMDTGFGGALRGQNQVDGMSVMSLVGCFLQAALKGYRSDKVDLSRVRLGDTSNVGTIVLRSLASIEGVTVSSTSLSAPREAQRAAERGRERISRQQFAEAEKELNKAVQIYPQYAEAWQDLGDVLQAQGRAAEARKAYSESLACDAKFVKPYLSLARLAAVEQKWQEVLERTGALLQLNPYEYPQAYYYSAVANYNLKAYDKAFDQVEQAVKLDPTHTVPLAEQLLGVLFSMKGDYRAAAEQFRNYLQHVPPTADVSAVKAMLAEVEKRLAPSGK